MASKSWTLRLRMQRHSTAEWLPLTGRVHFPPGQVATWQGIAERDVPLKLAAERMLADCHSMRWKPFYRYLDQSSPTAAQCRLFNSDGLDVPFGLGAGKGVPPVALVGACFEALEHAFSGPLIFDEIFDSVELHGRQELNNIVGDRAVQQLRDLGDKTASLKYDGLDGGPSLYLPLCLWAPWYLGSTIASRRLRNSVGDATDYTGLLSYSGNTGCAIGSTYDEAVLHAVNEWIERDALSIFLLRSIYDNGPMPHRVAPTSLPAGVRELLASAESRFDQPLFLLNLTTDIGVPVILAYLGDQDRLYGPAYGIGASLSSATAAERAITELVQGELLAEMVSEHTQFHHSDVSISCWPDYEQLVADHDIQQRVNSRLRPHPRLLACSSMDFAARLFERNPVDLPPSVTAAGTSVEAQHQAAVARIGAVGHRVMATTLKVFPHGSTLVQVQCLGLERFHLITKGHLALPGSRGIRARKSALQLSY